MGEKIVKRQNIRLTRGEVLEAISEYLVLRKQICFADRDDTTIDFIKDGDNHYGGVGVTITS